MFGRGERTDPESVRDHLSAVVGATRALNDGGPLDTILATILANCLDALGARAGSIVLQTENGAGTRVAATRGRSAETGRVVKIPMRADGRVVGALRIDPTGTTGTADDSAPDGALAEVFAELAASAVARVRAEEQGQRRSERLSQLVEAGNGLTHAAEPAVVGARILDAARDLLGATGGLVLTCADGRAPQLVGDHDVPRGLTRSAMLRETFRELFEGEGVTEIPAVADHPALAPLARRSPSAVVTSLQPAPAQRAVVISLHESLPSPGDLETWATYSQQAGFALLRSTLAGDVRAKEQELASLVTAVPDPFLVLDGSGRFMAINPAAGELLGLSPHFDVGSHASERLRSTELLALIAAPEGGSADVQITGSHVRILRARCVPIRAEGDVPPGRILSLEDVTASRETEQLKSDFVAVIGHELRTPLTMIKGYSATLAKRGEQLQPEARSRALQAMHDQTSRLQQLIEDLLLVARVERDRPPLHLEDRDVREVVRHACGPAMDLHPSHTFDVDLPPTPLLLPVDAVKVHQILHHLIDNACKFSDPESTVHVALEANDDGVEVRVTDEGIGIFSGDVDSLFDRFRQVDGSATRRHGGTGVGLYICKTLVEAHGGRIGVRSALGRGSTFWFRLPRAAEIRAVANTDAPIGLDDTREPAAAPVPQTS